MTMSFYHAAIIYSTKMYYKIHKIYTIFIVIPLALGIIVGFIAICMITISLPR